MANAAAPVRKYSLDAILLDQIPEAASLGCA
jgi:hypothetical protein